MKLQMGKIIRILRVRKNLQLTELAKRIGVSKGYLSMLENCKQTNPTRKTIMRLCRELCTSPNEIMGWEYWGIHNTTKAKEVRSVDTAEK